MSYDQYRPTGFRLLPPVVKNILIISGLFFLATISFQTAFHIDLNDLLGMHYFASEKFEPYQIVTYMFMHGGFSHILFNMFAFWMFGYVLENVWGSKRFLIYFLITGMGAALIQMLVFYFEISPIIESVDAYMMAPSVDAFKSFIDSGNFQVVSYDIQNHFNAFTNVYNDRLMDIGALQQLADSTHLQSIVLQKQSLSLPQFADSLREQSQMLTLQADALRQQSDSLVSVNVRSTVDFMMQYRNDYLNAPVVVGASGAVFGVLLAFGMMFPNTLIYIYFLFPIKAKWFVIIYGALELISGFSNAAGDNVAHFAHLGGMLFGFILIKIWNKRNRRTLF